MMMMNFPAAQSTSWVVAISAGFHGGGGGVCGCV